MAKSKTRRTSTVRRRTRGNTLLGILIGIVLGLAVAVATALLVNRTEVPFIGDTLQKPASGSAAPAAQTMPAPPAGELPDPNRGGSSATRTTPGQPAVQSTGVATITVAPAAQIPAPAPPSGSGSWQNPPPANAPLQTIPAPAQSPSATARPSPIPPPGGAPIRAATPSPAPQASITSTVTPSGNNAQNQGAAYLLQAGAFRGAEDADAMKLRLALLGMEAQVVTAEVGGATLYRVRVGPYNGLDAMTRARSRLAENGVEATVLRLR